jgi:DNA-binding MarR family transcriptional regulator
MESFKELLDEIRQLQLLVCLYHRSTDSVEQPTSIDHLCEELRITPEECGTIARSLVSDGLVEPTQSNGAGTFEGIRLTNDGRRRVESLGESSPVAAMSTAGH